MAEKVESKEATWRGMFPWMEIFRCFSVALDLNKLLLAAGGILVTFVSWWVLSLLFTANESAKAPTWPPTSLEEGQTQEQAWPKFRRDRERWNLLHEAAGLDRAAPTYAVEDIAETLNEYNFVSSIPDLPPGAAAVQAIQTKIAKDEKQLDPGDARRLKARAVKYALLGQPKPAGRLVVSPWSEDRGPNPYLLVTGQAGIPWEPGHFWEWFLRDQTPVMIEPLVKLLRPVLYFLSPRNSTFTRFYFLVVTIVTLLIWSVVGGAITRIAVVQLTRNERPGLFDSITFSFRYFLSYLFAPLFPLGLILLFTLLMCIFGLFHMIPVVGDIAVSGIFWFIPLGVGLGLAMALVGLISWPLMPVTISAEGTDSWEAVSRSYSYIYQRPWMCAWYSLVALAYGGIVVFFVGFMGSLTVYMAKWSVNANPLVGLAQRETNFLFIYAPTSFGWRELLLEGTKVNASKELIREDKDLEKRNGADVVISRQAQITGASHIGGVNRWDQIDPGNYDAYLKTLNWWNKFGAVLVAFWLGLVFLLVLGFGYSFFWTATTIIYLLVRKSVDLNELDEVYMEEDDYDTRFSMPQSPAPSPATGTVPTPADPGRATNLPMVTPPPPQATPTPAPVTPAPQATPVVAPPTTATTTTSAPEKTEKPSSAEPTTPEKKDNEPGPSA